MRSQYWRARTQHASVVCMVYMNPPLDGDSPEVSVTWDFTNFFKRAQRFKFEKLYSFWFSNLSLYDDEFDSTEILLGYAHLRHEQDSILGLYSADATLWYIIIIIMTAVLSGTGEFLETPEGTFRCGWNENCRLSQMTWSIRHQFFFWNRLIAKINLGRTNWLGNKRLSIHQQRKIPSKVSENWPKDFTVHDTRVG